MSIEPEPTTAVIVVAAGEGSRLGLGEPKALVPLVGSTILARSLDAIFGMVESVQIVVVAPAARWERAKQIVSEVAGSALPYVSVVVGGSTRQRSVSAGLAELRPSVDTVLVHDVARALTPSSLFDAVRHAVVQSGGGVIPVLPVADTVKKVDDRGRVDETVERASLRSAQTPQGFPRHILEVAHAKAVGEFTDDAALVAEHGFAVTTIAGDPFAFKITTPWDIRRAEQLLAPLSSGVGHGVRVGVGVDVHAFDPNAPLWLACLLWPNEPGLAGHSDGDVVAHAVCDALLSASGLGDMGGVFGTDDPSVAGAHGDVFLQRTVELVGRAGLRVNNVAVQIIGNRPRFGPRRVEAESRFFDLIGAPVAISATTTDHLGFTGRGEGLAAVAHALVSPRSESVGV